MMSDRLSKKQRSYLMSRVKSKGSKIEYLVFSYLRKRHIHFQRHYRRAPGTPDIARPSEKKAVFIHSDFWHGWQYPRWRNTLTSEFWRDKIESNRRRDKITVRRLRSAGWKVLTVWEHSLKKDLADTIDRICDFLKK